MACQPPGGLIAFKGLTIWQVPLEGGCINTPSRLTDRVSKMTGTLAQKVNRRSSDSITAVHLKRWLLIWPCVLVLDGLDEVASPHTREEVLRGISDLLLDARQMDADLRVVATTRPQGYKGEFHTGDYETLTLVPMDSGDALHHAERLAPARHFDDPEMRETVLERVKKAMTEEATARLTRTPLQVTIVSLLMERRARIPQHLGPEHPRQVVPVCSWFRGAAQEGMAATSRS
ncbi:hypothetical protein OH768_53420 [Streptomyces sp. NBC_01622]|uniref:hypothetical protein n=1 Tax=Streptomyces sp. NBC_01622 TaxID=2975903 RepID=UPI003866BDC0|nr:hypothetical protein OH768_53420 [Streptomyces sp. NBC_01622]